MALPCLIHGCHLELWTISNTQYALRNCLLVCWCLPQFVESVISPSGGVVSSWPRGHAPPMLLPGAEMSTVLMGGPNCQHGLVPVCEQQGH